MTFDPVAFVNLLLSSLIGVASGWLIAHLYWKRSAPVERILKELKRVLPAYLHPLRYPQFHTPSARSVEPTPAGPADLDVPRLVGAVLSEHPVRPGTQLELLLNILDRGRNFDNPAGLDIRDHRGRKVAAEFAGIGYAIARIDAVPAEGMAAGCITVQLADTAGKSHRQTLCFDFERSEANA